ncbi:hypothetical protein GQ600_16036 [Phytophthora cactorum]|nr:hypothetical protein GQ600_16036 [Phytophthora cactorum]
MAPVKWTGSKITGKLKVETMRLQGKSADEAFVLLKLDQAGDKLLENKQFSVWVSYMTKTTKKLRESRRLYSIQTFALKVQSIRV